MGWAMVVGIEWSATSAPVFLRDPILRSAALYWVAKCSSREMPSKHDIDPLDMPREMLPYLSIIERTRSGDDFYFRLCGTDVASKFDVDPTGKEFRSVFKGRNADCIRSLFATAELSQCAVYSESEFIFEEFNIVNFTMATRRLILPLHWNDRAAGAFMCAQTWPEKGSDIFSEYEVIISAAEIERHLANMITDMKSALQGAIARGII